MEQIIIQPVLMVKRDSIFFDNPEVADLENGILITLCEDGENKESRFVSASEGVTKERATLERMKEENPAAAVIFKYVPKLEKKESGEYEVTGYWEIMEEKSFREEEGFWGNTEI